MGASAGAIGRFNVGEGAEKREPAFGAKCGQRDLFGRLRISVICSCRALLRSVDGPTAPQK